jgi:hypothetical protein
MDFDLLDESYPLVKSNLSFKDFQQAVEPGVTGGLTACPRPANFGRQHMPPCFLVKLAHQKIIL